MKACFLLPRSESVWPNDIDMVFPITLTNSENTARPKSWLRDTGNDTDNKSCLCTRTVCRLVRLECLVLAREPAVSEGFHLHLFCRLSHAGVSLESG